MELETEDDTGRVVIDVPALATANPLSDVFEALRLHAEAESVGEPELSADSVGRVHLSFGAVHPCDARSGYALREFRLPAEYPRFGEERETLGQWQTQHARKHDAVCRGGGANGE